MSTTTHHSKKVAPKATDDEHPATSSGTMRLIGIVAAGAAVYALAPILVPFLLALVVAIAMSPVADRIERLGVVRTIASLVCLLLVAAALAGIVALVSNQVGTIFRHSDHYVDRLGDVSARVLRAFGGEQWLETMSKPEQIGEPNGDVGDALVSRAREMVRGDAREIGRWALTGIGGVFGVLGDTIVFLAFFFYMLQGRADWIDRLRKTAIGLGMRPRHHEFARVANDLKTYLATLAIVSTVYFVVISAALWLIGVPQFLLWGLLTAVLELVPFFGPVIACVLPTIASLGTGVTWQPFAVITLFVVLQTIEGYVVAPLLYGKAVEIEPVTVILGVMFFGWLLGPAGLALAMPLMILLRAILIITPDTPALDALADTEGAAPGS